jgi:hypothetical protein
MRARPAYRRNRNREGGGGPRGVRFHAAKRKAQLNSPAFETAATSAGVDIHDIPGRTIGYLHPKREVILVRTAGAAAAIVISFGLRRNINFSVGAPALEATRSAGNGRRLSEAAMWASTGGRLPSWRRVSITRTARVFFAWMAGDMWPILNSYRRSRGIRTTGRGAEISYFPQPLLNYLRTTTFLICFSMLFSLSRSKWI